MADAGRAEGIRHLDDGFAIEFVSPDVEFRRTVSELRRSAASEA